MKPLRSLIISLSLGLASLVSAQANSIPTVFGNALAFNGTNQYVSVTNFGKIIPTNEITVEFWANTTQIAGQSAFMLSPDYGTNRLNAHINYANGGTFGNTYWDFGNINTAGRVGPIAAPANSLGNWVHYAFVASQSSNYMRIYTNGNLFASRSGMTPFLRGNYELRIGGGGSNYFNYNGRLDEFRVWKTALSQAQIQANLGMPLAGNEAGLLLYYRFNSIAGTVATNSAFATGAAYNGQLVNGPAWAISDAPARLVVSNLNDSGLGSLRQAIAVASSGGSTITFASNLSGKIITLTSGELPLNQNLTIDASALTNGIILNGNRASRIFEVASATTNILTALTIINGYSTNSYGAGVLNNGTLTLNRCTLTGNTAAGAAPGAGLGGGICNLGNQTLTLNQCTLVGNSAQDSGGGVFNYVGTLNVNQCTIFGNSAGSNYFGGGGGIINYAGPAGTLYNSIVARNTGIENTNYGGAFTLANNLTNGDPLLAPLGNYGGPTQTMPPLPGSPAIDAGGASTFTTDQRGRPRVVGSAPDIGAVEFQDASPLVLNNADSGMGSLRYAVTYCPLGSTVTFTNTLSGQTILLTSGELLLNRNLTIDGSALTAGITIDGNHLGRIFEVAGGGTVMLNSLTVSNGFDSAGNGGGGLLNNAGCNLTLNKCTVVKNSTTYNGGAFRNLGILTANESTFEGNSCSGAGGVFSGTGATTINQCTLSQNSALGGGGGIYVYGSVTVKNSIVAGNTGPFASEDIQNYTGSLTYVGANIVQSADRSAQSGPAPITAAPLLAPLGNYGGTTPTMPPLAPGSPAVDGCTKGTDFKTDQRGLPRIAGAFADIGAVEVQAVSAATPVLTLLAPAAGQLWSNSVFATTGTVHDKLAVAKVLYSLNGADWLAAVPSNLNNWTNWTATLSLVPGTNLFQVYAIDAGGNISALKTVRFIYVVMEPLTLQITGHGVLSPNYSNAVLQLGRNYSITAAPGAGYVFSNWMGGAFAATNVLASQPKLNFAMSSNLVLQANFVPNPFPAVAGNYQGLFYDTNQPGQLNAGFFTATINGNGSFTAKLQSGSKKPTLSGQFSVGGTWFTNNLGLGTNLTYAGLQLDLSGHDVLTGYMAGATESAELMANRLVFTNANPAPQAGKYTLIIPGSADSTNQPGGNGFGAVSVSTNGTLTFAGRLGDGTNATQGTFVSKQGRWPFYVSLYGDQGSIFGWLVFTNDTDRDIDGVLNWTKPPQPGAALYPAGFTLAGTNAPEVAGSRFAVTNGLRVLALTNGVLILDNGNLAQSFTNGFTLGTNNLASGTNLLKLTITNSSGLFSGSVTNPAAGRLLKFGGAVLQKQNAGYGQFPGTNQTGSLFIGPE